MKKEPINIEHLSKENIFKVPEGYFEVLPDIVLSQIKLNSQTKNIEGFKIPNNYFDSLSSKILSKINAKQHLRLEDIPKVNIFNLPDNYFENLEEQIIEKVSVSNLPKGNIFKVPVGYFESLPNRINSKIKQQQSGSVFKIIRSTKVWAAAASIVVLVGLAWLIIPNLVKSDVELALEKASVEEIQTYLNTQDLSYLEYENSVVEESKSTKQVKANADSLLFENLNLEKKDILEHIEEQNLDENELEYLLGS